MKQRGERKQDLNSVPLVTAVLCVDCETISDSPHDKCLVCGSNSLFNLRRMLDGNLPHEPELNDSAKYNLEITARVSGISGNDLSHTTQSISRLLASNQSRTWDSFHVHVEPVLESGEESKMMAA